MSEIGIYQQQPFEITAIPLAFIDGIRDGAVQNCPRYLL
jgi:hypothetical protein